MGQRQQVRVFLSSTFSDFMEERDLLAREVFPALRQRARQRGVDVVDVDLRWGITRQQSREGRTIAICLAEIERCRPYFIGLIGDRYGWVPQPGDYSAELLARQPWLSEHQGGASVTELEILHGVLNNKEMAGRAFFYFRDAAYSDARADAGESGWRSVTAEDREKLEQLKQRIRRSGFPVVDEGLLTPAAIAERIAADLQALIEAQFPPGEKPDRLAQEEQRHASYRADRTQLYLGGERYTTQLAGWLADSQQRIVITGESGAGKSALIANWMVAHQQNHPEDVMYAHHLGCSNDASAVRPLLGRLIDSTSRLLAEELSEPLPVPEDWWELVAKVGEALAYLSSWCQRHQCRWIWVLDGLDKLDTDDQQALPWLPVTLPPGIHVVASALECRALQILLTRGYTNLAIGPLQTDEQLQLITQYLELFARRMEGALTLQLLRHKLAGSPLFLRTLLEELRLVGRFETLDQQLKDYLQAQTIDDLYQRVVERLEGDAGRDAVCRALTALWASRTGLGESELLEITGLTPSQWAPIGIGLQEALGNADGRLVFGHDYLRRAVQQRYLPGEDEQRKAHSDLADWYADRKGWDERDSEELPWQLQQAGRMEDLRHWLLMPAILANLQADRGSREVINYWLAARGEGDGELDELIADDLEEEIERRREDAEDLIWFVDSIAALFDEAGLYREPLLKLRELSLELEKASDDRSEEARLSSLAWLADAHRDLGHYDVALPLYQRCLQARERLLGPEHPSTLTTVGNLAGLFQDKGDYEQAEAYYTRCLEACERLLGPEHPSTLTTVGNLGVLFKDKGDYEQAEAYYTRCLEARERRLGPEHPDTLTTVGNLGNLYRAKGDYEQAEAYYTRALEAFERLLGPEHPNTLTTVGNLGLLYGDKFDYEQAEAYFTRDLEASERLLGPEHPSTLATVGNLAGLFQDKGDYEQAEAYYTRCLEASERLLGPEHPDTLTTVSNLGLLYSDKGDYEQAEAYYTRCLEARERLLGPEHPSTLATVGNLGVLFKDKGDYEQAEAYYTRCLEACERLLGPEHPNTLITAYNLADLLSQQERHAEAISLRRRELAWCRKQNGDTAAGTLTSINGLAIDLRETGELEEAEALFRELVAARQQVLEPEDFQIGRALGGLARTLELAGKLEEALDLRQQALAHRLAHQGPDDYFTNSARLELARLLHRLGRKPEATTLLQELQLSMGRLENSDDDDRAMLAEAEALLGDSATP